MAASGLEAGTGRGEVLESRFIVQAGVRPTRFSFLEEVGCDRSNWKTCLIAFLGGAIETAERTATYRFLLAQSGQSRTSDSLAIEERDFAARRMTGPGLARHFRPQPGRQDCPRPRHSARLIFDGNSWSTDRQSSN